MRVLRTTLISAAMAGAMLALPTLAVAAPVDDPGGSYRDVAGIEDFPGFAAADQAGAITAPVTGPEKVSPQARKRAEASGSRCPLGHKRIACVNLNRQEMYVQDADGNEIFGPVPIRSGRNGFETRTGMKKIYQKKRNHWSTLYHVNMPYTQFFDGGIAFHGISGSVYSKPGSHGCVNMRMNDAKKLYDTTKNGDKVFVWGRKPGT